jgi:hypothetical protein
VTTAKRTEGRLYRTLDCLVGELERLSTIHRKDLLSGDRLTIATENSVYSLLVLENLQYIVHGGWFDRESAASDPISVAGCTWGGSVIMTNIVAAVGLRVEFGNGVVTSPVRDAGILRCGTESSPELGLEAIDRHFLESVGMNWRIKQS